MTYASIKEYKTLGVVRPSLWGRDHLSTLRYLETYLTEHHNRFFAQPNPHMRTDPSTFGSEVDVAHPFSRHQLLSGASAPTRLLNGEELKNHDDWSCLWDMGAVGALSYHPSPLSRHDGRYFMVKLTHLGDQLAAELRRLRRAGVVDKDIKRSEHLWMKLESAYETLLGQAPLFRGPEQAKLRSVEIGETLQYGTPAICSTESFASRAQKPCYWNKPVSFFDPYGNPGHLFPDMIANRWPDRLLLAMG